MKLHTVTFCSAVLIIMVLLPASLAVAASSCEQLTSLALINAKITSAHTVLPGEFRPPGGRESSPGNPVFKQLPAFCRIAATLTPSSDSDIKVEVWMPVSNWNGKFQAVGNGGWAGSISYPEMADALRRGYATSSTDTGHTGGGGSFAANWEKYVDYSYRSEHEMTVQSKAVIAAFYGNGPRLSYWNGCSTGGRQGLMEAQRFPDDFDGIIAGDPANPKAYLNAWTLAINKTVFKDPASFIPPGKYPMIHQAVVNACDAVDGLKDGLIEDPRKCQFDFQVLACKAEDNATCLTGPQIETAKKVLTPAKTQDGREIFPGHVLGPELGWGRFLS